MTRSKPKDDDDDDDDDGDDGDDDDDAWHCCVVLTIIVHPYKNMYLSIVVLYLMLLYIIERMCIHQSSLYGYIELDTIICISQYIILHHYIAI